MVDAFWHRGFMNRRASAACASGQELYGHHATDVPCGRDQNVLRLRRPATWVTAVVLGFAPAPALAQQIPLAISAPGAGAQLLEPSRPAPITLTPTIAVFEEYNDNLFLNNSNRRSDWITAIAPAFTLTRESETDKLTAGYHLAGGEDAGGNALNEGLERAHFVLGGLCRPG